MRQGSFQSEPDDRKTESSRRTMPLASPASPPRRAAWRGWLREPLLHFLLIGIALFAGYRALHPSSEAGAQSTRIELTQDDLIQMSVTWLAQGRPPPTPEQMRSLVESRVREEILYREALALGLDKGDTIIRRRLAQKMEFLAEDVSALKEPGPEEIRAWFANNAQRFALAPRVSFRHLYFSFDRRGERAREAAAEARGKLAGKAGEWPAVTDLADPFMFQDHYADRSFDEMAKLFGPSFARELLRLEPGSWQGPIQSGYGWHLIWVDSIAPSRVPAFEEIEPEVKSEWLMEQRAEAKRIAFQAMRARYLVVLPEPPPKAAVGPGAPVSAMNR
jgi:peptidyl-prolyl cis-trans isomerase C